MAALLLLAPATALAASSPVSAVYIVDPNSAMGGNTASLGIGLAVVRYHRFELNVDAAGQDVTTQAVRECGPRIICHTTPVTSFQVLPYIGVSAHVTRYFSLGLDSSFVSGQIGKPALTLRVDL